MTYPHNPSEGTKELCYRRDDWSCVRCGASLFSVSGSLHHRKPRSIAHRGEMHQASNLILLCGSGTTGCHGWVHAHPKEARKHGWILRSWDTPREAPVETMRGLMLLDDHGGMEEVPNVVQS
jgi:5-methylcytosine-specific restriction endonuclease McrA